MGQNNQNDGGSMNTKDFIIGALVGSIVGAATALLLAPKSGRELRSDLNEQAILLKEKTGQWKELAVEGGTQIASTAREKTSEWTQMIQQQSNELKNKVKSIRVGDHQEVRDQGEEEAAVSDTEIDVEQRLQETKKAFDELEETYKG
ncbi:gas vesicle protein [Bacillus oleivorans]|uniref:Gas vesicle protein n=1 Tax=Bacillus oleivorans TaxID=1448271 RepID=A0A285CVD9_9BACI|nr:YtxH domain-containing protein [Bacillus oleivorans]SNX71385.1 gas vesicle protein [Bacillus oleivorans]